LATCAACRADVRDLGDVVEALAVMAPSAQPPVGFVGRVLAAGAAEGLAGAGGQVRAGARPGEPLPLTEPGAGGGPEADGRGRSVAARPSDLPAPGRADDGEPAPSGPTPLAPPAAATGASVPPPRIAARSRRRWLRPALLGAAAAAVVALVAGLALGPRHDASHLDVALDARTLRASSMVGAGDYAVGQAFLSQGTTP